MALQREKYSICDAASSRNLHALPAAQPLLSVWRAMLLHQGCTQMGIKSLSHAERLFLQQVTSPCSLVE